MPTPTPVKIQTRFKYVNKDIRDIWESFHLVDYYMDDIHAKLQQNRVGLLKYMPLWSSAAKTASRQDVFGAISHLVRKVNPRRVLTDSVAAFEGFIGDVVSLVYRDYPQKLLGATAGTDPDVKIINIVITSASRDEMIDRVIEERVRSLFYGDPLELFLKDKARVEVGDYYKIQCPGKVDDLREILARRNILVHNAGRVDRKCLREVHKSGFRIDQMVPLPASYLRDCLATLHGMSATFAALVLKNIYKDHARGKLRTSVLAFERGVPVPSTHSVA